jgi:hypothetical protein
MRQPSKAPKIPFPLSAVRIRSAVRAREDLAKIGRYLLAAAERLALVELAPLEVSAIGLIGRVVPLRPFWATNMAGLKPSTKLSGSCAKQETSEVSPNGRPGPEKLTVSD